MGDDFRPPLRGGINVKKTPIRDMCEGCARNRLTFCEIISEPIYIHKRRGKCFAKVNKIQAKEIEERIKYINSLPNTGLPRKGK